SRSFFFYVCTFNSGIGHFLVIPDNAVIYSGRGVIVIYSSSFHCSQSGEKGIPGNGGIGDNGVRSITVIDTCTGNGNTGSCIGYVVTADNYIGQQRTAVFVVYTRS